MKYVFNLKRLTWVCSLSIAMLLLLSAFNVSSAFAQIGTPTTSNKLGTPPPTITPKPQPTNTTSNCLNGPPCPTPTPVPSPTVNPTITVPPVSTPLCDAGGPYLNIPCTAGSTPVQLDGAGSQSFSGGGLSYSWTTNCPSGSFDSGSSAQPILSFVPVSSDGSPVSCDAFLTVTDSLGGTASCQSSLGADVCVLDCQGALNGSAVADRCGVCNGDGQSCLGCKTVSVASDLIILDGNALAQRNQVLRALRVLDQKQGATKRFRRFIANTKKEAQNIYIQSWTTTYSLPQVFKDCSSTQFCVAVSTAAQTDIYKANAKRFTALALRVSKNLRKIGVRARTISVLNARARKLQSRALTGLESIPATTSSCS